MKNKRSSDARKGLGMGMVRIAGLWRDTVLSGTPVKGWGVNLATVLSPWDGGTIRADLATGPVLRISSMPD